MRIIVCIILAMCLFSEYGICQSRANLTYDDLLRIEEDFDTDSEDNFLEMTEKLIKHTEVSYEYVETQTKGSYTDIVYKGENPSGEPCEIIMKFSTYRVGRNEALEIPGEKRYCLYEINGRYLDLFSIWKHFIHPEADVEKLAVSRGESIRRWNDEKRDIQFTLELSKRVEGGRPTFSILYSSGIDRRW